ncbi:MAG: FKBP-type peptidyl-prolyl cis-trans isomerase [Bacteroidetes bacterium]|nr:FKBP-type peptidyl-prolyl cis-trans isomerase [Bacteroidota bacterium]
MSKRIAILIIAASSLLTFCGSPEKKPLPKVSDQEIKDGLEYANKYLVRTETQEIEGYLNRHKWPVTISKTGLRYWIYEQKNGDKPKNGQTVVLNYTLKLLNGITVYDSSKDGQKRFVLGYLSGERGLDEAVSMLGKGDKARLIVPAHLGFGILGDKNRVPPKSTLIYDIELVDFFEN